MQEIFKADTNVSDIYWDTANADIKLAKADNIKVKDSLSGNSAHYACSVDTLGGGMQDAKTQLGSHYRDEEHTNA